MTKIFMNLTFVKNEREKEILKEFLVILHLLISVALPGDRIEGRF